MGLRNLQYIGNSRIHKEIAWAIQNLSVIVREAICLPSVFVIYTMCTVTLPSEFQWIFRSGTIVTDQFCESYEVFLHDTVCHPCESTHMAVHLYGTDWEGFLTSLGW